MRAVVFALSLVLSAALGNLLAGWIYNAYLAPPPPPQFIIVPQELRFA